MESFGAYLRQLREEKGVSREEVSSRTKISMKYLTALEEDDLGKIPNEVFAKGFIRSYARCLALEEDEVLTRFEELAASFYHRKVEQIRTEQRKEDQQKELVKRKQMLMQWGAGLTVLVIAVGLFVQNELEHRRRQVPDTAETKIQEPENSEQPVGIQTINPPKDQSEGSFTQTDQNAETPLVPLTMNPPQPASIAPPAVSSPLEQRTVAKKEQTLNRPSEPPQKPLLPDPLTLRIEAVERSWVLVKIDDAVTKEVILNPGQKVDWTAHNQFRLSLENAGGVKVEFNGKLLDPFGPRGVVVKDVVLPRE